MTPEVAIRRPMVTQPPIEGNLDCRARPFHSELCFDIATFRIQPELKESFRLLQRYHMEHLLTPRDFFYPRVALDFYQSMTTNQVRDPTVIHFTIDGRHVASSEPTPEVSPSTPQVTPQPPPIIPPTSEPSPSAEPRIAIPIIEYRGLCHTFQALATSHSILTQQITTLRAHQE
ncbi:hypothetical protein VitviT2T_024646 [Vitis vinifera]|uniref:Uncharacterized protein n=1 Tax=Vitis vinifera TaxID=29760 RepID=A0ABY9DIS6_VITVI|nr:hypothetical protein VitviT2T_024646 [Vitis vinifera]